MLTKDRRLSALMNAARRQAAPAYRRAMASMIRGRPDDQAWNEWRAITGRSILLSMLLAADRVMAQARRLGVRVPDDGEPIQPEKFAAPGGSDLRVAIDAGDTDMLVSEPMIQAVEGFRGRVPDLTRNVHRMADRARDVTERLLIDERAQGVSNLLSRSSSMQDAIRRRFWVSDVTLGVTVNLQELIADAIAGDLDLDVVGVPEFIERAQLAGAGSLTDHRLETVYRTNLSSEYNRAHAESLTDPAVRQVLPLSMLQEIQDDRARETHRRMNGLVLPADRMRAYGLVPPNGYQCRGTIRGVSWTEADQLGLLTDGQLDEDKLRTYNGERWDLVESGAYPDPGFGGIATRATA